MAEEEKKKKKWERPITGKGRPHFGEMDVNRIAFCEGILAGKPLYRAYEDVPGWSGKGASARSSASAVSTEVEVQAYLAARRLELYQTTDVTPERVIEEMAVVAFFDPAEIIAQKIETPEDIAKLPEHVRRCIVGWKWDKFRNLVLILADKLSALDKLAKHLGLYQADAPHFSQSPAALLATVQWRFVISMHVHRDVSVAEALAYAHRHPEEVEAWGRDVGITGDPKKKALAPGSDEPMQDAVIVEQGGDL
jgi:hypothetical protein